MNLLALAKAAAELDPSKATSRQELLQIWRILDAVSLLIKYR